MFWKAFTNYPKTSMATLVGAGWLTSIVTSEYRAYHINKQIEKMHELENNGEMTQAAKLAFKLATENPDCKACRGHMGRLAFELKNTSPDVEQSNLPNLNK